VAVAQVIGRARERDRVAGAHERQRLIGRAHRHHLALLGVAQAVAFAQDRSPRKQQRRFAPVVEVDPHPAAPTIREPKGQQASRARHGRAVRPVVRDHLGQAEHPGHGLLRPPQKRK